jgi:hypothetical protein
VVEHARNGLSLREFAGRRGVSVNTLAYWKYTRRIANAGVSASTLVPVKLIDDLRCEGADLVVDVGGARLTIPSGCDLEQVARVLALLRRQPC